MRPRSSRGVAVRSGSSTDEALVLERLRMVRVAKDVFQSEWYQAACGEMGFGPEACEALSEISRETAKEREAALQALQRGSARLSGGPPAHVDGAFAWAARRTFLLTLIDAKQAMGEAFERAALVAPTGLRQDLQALAAIDFRHVVRLRELLVQESREERP